MHGCLKNGILVGVRFHEQTSICGERGNRTGDILSLAGQTVCLEVFFEEYAKFSVKINDVCMI